MAILKYQCLNCSGIFDFDAGQAKFTSRHKLKEEFSVTCPICNENKKLKVIHTPEFEKLYLECYEKYTRKQTIKGYKPGKLIEYHKIFGIDKKITICHNGIDYYILDTYCVNPYCSCKTAYLNFFDDNSLKIKYPAFSFAIDYNMGILQETINISEQRAYEIYIGFSENLLYSRHEELKNELHPFILKKFKNDFVPTKKLGRNEPCYCGSGKKYKKCCLEDDIKKYGGRIRVKDEVIH